MSAGGALLRPTLRTRIPPTKSLLTSISRLRFFSLSARLDVQCDYTHAVVGAGVVGLAVAARLAKKEGTSTIVLEKHGAIGTETSSRNSEVIHAGLYYPKDSLKAALCIRGNTLLYQLCKKYHIPHRRTGKWLVAQDERQMAELHAMHEHAAALGVPTRFVNLEEAKRREPEVLARVGILESPNTGIVDSHALMLFLEGSLGDSEGTLALNTKVEGIDRLDGGESYRITYSSADTGDTDTITASKVINSAGLYAPQIANLILPQSQHITPYYAKGSYFSYSASRPKPSILVYPAPVRDLGGLGTHLTLDMSGRMKFGPDVEWVDDPADYTPNPERMAAAIVAAREYLPGIDESAVNLDYCGIRPKLRGKGMGNSDFVIREEEGLAGFVNLLGIESPGLTSSLAIAERVYEILYGREDGKSIVDIL